jgi:hypothetical protein
MKPRLRSYDPLADLQMPTARPAANDAVTRSTMASVTRMDGRSVLETRYPDMVQSIALMWGYPEMNAFFDRLWLADGSQTPIDPDAMSELMVLAQIHQSIVPTRPARSLATIYGTDYSRPGRKDVWEDVPPRR